MIKYIFIIFFTFTSIYSQEKIKVYIFFSEECPICQYYCLPLRELYKVYKSNDNIQFNLVFSNKSSSIDKISKFKSKYKIDCKSILDSNQIIAKELQANVTPEVVVMRGTSKIYQGRIDDSFFAPGCKRGVVQNFELKEILAKLVKNETVNYFQTKAVGCFITFR